MGSPMTLTTRTSESPGASRSASRRSYAKEPIPHARGGYVEKIAVRMSRPLLAARSLLALLRLHALRLRPVPRTCGRHLLIVRHTLGLWSHELSSPRTCGGGT